MTLTAVAQASDEDLKELGLSRKEDRLTLINLCKKSGDQKTHEKKQISLLQFSLITDQKGRLRQVEML